MPGTKKDEKIIVLRKQSSLIDSKIDEEEDKYKKKFGCKVVILEPGLELVDIING
ncbi:hypothetical protein [Clostridium felsineum]|uniref:Uncharacterized protein n=1 Tax=Clostridium felsineum TaxID=36839 RepID=A0A1S8KZS7_9CLOT|nr:hypothetical protein [Clostridium felsineum]URZ06477.1 hypothetical protein CLROS_018100 [Clostridium felsineum]URZ11512.1 hypothetical protein CROST_022290 [Clostridium felsineum]